jgi:hypothetical protein
LVGARGGGGARRWTVVFTHPHAPESVASLTSSRRIIVVSTILLSNEEVKQGAVCQNSRRLLLSQASRRNCRMALLLARALVTLVLNFRAYIHRASPIFSLHPPTRHPFFTGSQAAEAAAECTLPPAAASLRNREVGPSSSIADPESQQVAEEEEEGALRRRATAAGRSSSLEERSSARHRGRPARARSLSEGEEDGACHLVP